MLAARLERGALADGFTAREVRRKRWRHLSTESAVNAALECLEAEGWIHAMPSAAGANGRHTTRYLINPEISQTSGCTAAVADETPVLPALSAPYMAVPEISRKAANG
jgi:hypothetical protein